MARSSCTLCPWQSRDWATHDQAGCEASWHVYEEHRDVWIQFFGTRPPLDPDPRK